MSEREFRIGLYRMEDCRRGWLAYSERSLGRVVNVPFDMVLTVSARNLSQAKSRAITEANRQTRYMS